MTDSNESKEAKEPQVAIPQALLDHVIANYKKPTDLIGENGMLKQLTKVVIEAALAAKMNQQYGAAFFYSVRIFAMRMTFSHFVNSERRCLSNSSGVLPATSMPNPVKRSRTSGAFSAATNWVLSVLMIASGVPTAASMAYQRLAS